MAMHASATMLCAAGPRDGYAPTLDRETTAFELVDVGDRPYWATNGPNGEECWVPVNEDEVVVMDPATAEPVATIAVGDHPQRVREGVVARRVLRSRR